MTCFTSWTVIIGRELAADVRALLADLAADLHALARELTGRGTR